MKVSIYVTTPEEVEEHELDLLAAFRFCAEIRQKAPKSRFIFPVNDGGVSDQGMAFSQFSTPYYSEWILIVSM